MGFGQILQFVAAFVPKNPIWALVYSRCRTAVKAPAAARQNADAPASQT